MRNHKNKDGWNDWNHHGWERGGWNNGPGWDRRSAFGPPPIPVPIVNPVPIYRPIPYSGVNVVADVPVPVVETSCNIL